MESGRSHPADGTYSGMRFDISKLFNPYEIRKLTIEAIFRGMALVTEIAFSFEAKAYQQGQFDRWKIFVLQPSYSPHQARLAHCANVAQIDGAWPSQAVGPGWYHLYKRRQPLDPARNGGDDGGFGITISDVILQHYCRTRLAYLRPFDGIEAHSPNFTSQDLLHH